MTPNLLEGFSDDELVNVAANQPLDAGKYSIEMMRRLKEAILEQTGASREQTTSSHKLNSTMLWLMWAMFILAAVQIVLTFFVKS